MHTYWVGKELVVLWLDLGGLAETMNEAGVLRHENILLRETCK